MEPAHSKTTSSSTNRIVLTNRFSALTCCDNEEVNDCKESLEPKNYEKNSKSQVTRRNKSESVYISAPKEVREEIERLCANIRTSSKGAHKDKGDGAKEDKVLNGSDNNSRPNASERRKKQKAKLESSLTVLSTNADQLPNKLDELRQQVDISKPHIICVTEVNPKNARYKLTEPELSLEGYDSWCVLETGRGVIIYTKKVLNAELVSLNSIIKDAVFISVKLKDSDKLLIGCIYRSPSSSADENKQLNEMLTEACSLNYSHLLITGDLNYGKINWINWTTPGDNREAEDHKFLETCRDNYLYQHVQEPTRGRRNNEPSLLDLILTNEENMIENIKYKSPLGASDHIVLSFNFKCYALKKKTTRIRYQYDKADYEKMRQLLDIDWNERLLNESVSKNVDQQYKIFREKYQEVVDMCVPIKKISESDSEKGKPVDPVVLKRIRKKHRAWQRFLETRDGKDHQKYCRERNQVKSLIRKFRKNLEMGIAKQIKINPKKFWSYVRSKTKTRPTIPDLEMETSEGTRKTANDNEKANTLQKYFSSVFTEEPPGEIPVLPNLNVEHRMPRFEVRIEDIEKKLRGLNPSKSPGPDKVCTSILKETAQVIAKPLAIIFQTSMDTSILPQVWKQANITAIFKKGRKDLPSNYRPVSLTSVPCKVMESLIREKIVEHLKINNLLSNKQYGFISGRSTTQQLLKVLDLWTEIADLGGQVDTIFMDFMKAFDKVPHRRLIGKVKSYKIEEKIVEWLRNFLQDRTQIVCVNEKISEPSPVISGIPQGSVLGPTMFIIYINDLPDIVESEVFLFADDTKIFRHIRSEKDREILQQDLIKLCEWSRKWLVLFHPDKCKLMIVGRKEYDTSYAMIDSDGKSVPLGTTTSEKDIGVYMDGQLSFSDHIAEKVNVANRNMGIIRRTFKFLDKDMFLHLYRAQVRPHIEYANVVWHPYKIKDIETIERVQRRATKLIPGLKDRSYEQRLRTLGLFTLAFRRLRGDLIETYKIVSGLSDPETSPDLHLLGETNTRGNGRKLEVRRADGKHMLRHNFFTIRVAKVWNELPREVVWARSLDDFKNKLDRFTSDHPLRWNYKYKID